MSSLLEQAFASTRGVLENVKPDQLDDPTPCQSWQVRELINHIVSGALWFAESTENGESTNSEPERDWTAGNYVADFDAASKRAVAAFANAGDKTVKLPFGEFPAAAFQGLATTDTFTHGWDLARATGQDANLDPQLAEQLLAAAKMMIPDAFRGAEGAPFGPPVEIADSAPAADRLAAFLGRQA